MKKYSLFNPLLSINVLIQNWDLLVQLTKRNIAMRYRGSALGLFWSFAQPLMMLGVYSFVFGIVFKARWGEGIETGGAAFPVIMFCGMAVFNIFSESVNNCTSVIVGNPSYVKKVIFPLEILPLTVVAASFIFGLAWFFMLLLGVAFFMGHISWTMILFPITFIPLLLLTAGVSYFVASLGVYLRDIQQVVAIITQILFFMTPIFYPISIVPEKIRWVLEYNPLSSLVEQTRIIFLYGRQPDWLICSIIFLASYLVFLIGFAWFSKTKKDSRMSFNNDVIIDVKNISKFFEIYEKPSHRLWQMLYRGRKQFYRPFWALKDISFKVRRGECVGIVGKNGAGKSTLLQIVTGTLSPSSGSVRINGRVAALLELGSGFNPEFTGRENVYLNASILGLNEKEIEKRYNDIVSFADIGDFIDQPVKSYSSGMTVRLAFAVVAHVDADVLIVDEALSVGDAFFYTKVYAFLRNFMETKTVLFVSHDTAAVKNLCNHAILLEKGSIKLTGTPKEVTEKYLEDIYESVQGESTLTLQEEVDIPEKLCPEELDFCDMRRDFINHSPLRNDIEIFHFSNVGTAFGKGGAVIKNVFLTDFQDKPMSWIIGGEIVKLKIICSAHKELFSPIVGFIVKDRLGQTLFGDNTYISYKEKPLTVERGKFFIAEFIFRMPILLTGNYSITVAIAEGTQSEHIQHEWRHDALMFQSHSTSCTTGLIGIPMKNITLKNI